MYILAEKRDCLTLELNDADRRFNIAIHKMNEITKRVHELEVNRNNALRDIFIKDNNLDYPLTNQDPRDIIIYEEVLKGYRSMSRRKNELEEERNYIVKEIEDL